MNAPRTPARGRGLHRIARAAAALVLACAGNLPAQAPAPTEYQVKAAYLANLGRFVEWPARAGAAEDQPFNVCVLGDDPFGPALDAALAGETINRAPLISRRIAQPRDAGNCRILFIPLSADARLKAILADLGNAGVLTVSDIPQFSRRGGMIELVLVGNRVRFEINMAAASRSGLTLSSELLKLAVAVRKAL
jgi:hypothetical protein